MIPFTLKFQIGVVAVAMIFLLVAGCSPPPPPPTSAFCTPLATQIRAEVRREAADMIPFKDGSMFTDEIIRMAYAKELAELLAVLRQDIERDEAGCAA